VANVLLDPGEGLSHTRRVVVDPFVWPSGALFSSIGQGYSLFSATVNSAPLAPGMA
jgi:hypothetical protein